MFKKISSIILVMAMMLTVAPFISADTVNASGDWTKDISIVNILHEWQTVATLVQNGADDANGLRQAGEYYFGLKHNNRHNTPPGTNLNISPAGGDTFLGLNKISFWVKVVGNPGHANAPTDPTTLTMPGLSWTLVSNPEPMLAAGNGTQAVGVGSVYVSGTPKGEWVYKELAVPQDKTYENLQGLRFFIGNIGATAPVGDTVYFSGMQFHGNLSLQTTISTDGTKRNDNYNYQFPGEKRLDYAAKTPLDVEVTNVTTTINATGLTATVVPTSDIADAFSVSPTTFNLNASATQVVQVVPRTGLPDGTHKATIEIKDGDTVLNYFNVIFRVIGDFQVTYRHLDMTDSTFHGSAPDEFLGQPVANGAAFAPIGELTVPEPNTQGFALTDLTVHNNEEVRVGSVNSSGASKQFHFQNWGWAGRAIRRLTPLGTLAGLENEHNQIYVTMVVRNIHTERGLNMAMQLQNGGETGSVGPVGTIVPLDENGEPTTGNILFVPAGAEEQDNDWKVIHGRATVSAGYTGANVDWMRFNLPDKGDNRFEISDIIFSNVPIGDIDLSDALKPKFVLSKRVVTIGTDSVSETGNISVKDAAKDVTVSVDYTNTSATNVGSAVLIAALYSNNKLVSVNVSDPADIGAGNVASVTGTLTTTMSAIPVGTYALKHFVWNSETGMVPVRSFVEEVPE